jgi:hypothetical protein
LTVFVPLTPIVCFYKGTKILCIVDGKEVEIPIENITIGTQIKTFNGLDNKVIHITHNYLNNKLQPRLKKIHYMETNDLYITGNHKVYNKDKDVFVKASKLNTFKLVNSSEVFEVYNLVLENTDDEKTYGIFANQVICESLPIKTYILLQSK